VYPTAIDVTRLWTTTSGTQQGQGIAVAVIDSGIAASHPDFLDSQGQSRVVASVYLNRATDNRDDAYGHGTHVAGLIGGNGQASGGAFLGVAPQVNLVNVKVSDDAGNCRPRMWSMDYSGCSITPASTTSAWSTCRSIAASTNLIMWTRWTRRPRSYGSTRSSSSRRRAISATMRCTHRPTTRLSSRSARWTIWDAGCVG